MDSNEHALMEPILAIIFIKNGPLLEDLKTFQLGI